MDLPKYYADILEENKLLKSIVYSTIETFGEILTENNLYFFEEYTDHGIKHIESVLRSTIDIIPEESLKHFFDCENVAALILSVVLHDLGMHQTYHTFTHLISHEDIIFPELDVLSWKELWLNYSEEAKKFNSQQKYAIFGDYDYVVSIPNFENKDDLDGHQKKLIGEFIRRHHHRLAHEIAVTGLLTNSSYLSFADNYDRDKLNIVGLIARSHGIEIRETYEYIKNKFYRLNKTPYNIHVYYLMIILRMSDYFQIDINRLYLTSLKLKKFKSPISELEHDKHFSIKEISQIDEDPETLFVRALPANNFIYWKLFDLLKDIQIELDKCWAILGEKYGKDNTKPLLKYRRIISNLEEKVYKESIQFIPERILFSSDQDLAKLLVIPLYGSNPTFGVRELIQNSTDAIYERIFRENLQDDHLGLIEIIISHDSNEEYYFEIKDNGKGMSVKEIKDYFLKAGATNRKSKEWDDLYVDTEMNTKISKSGKFGVGILAAFLIGDELEVTTRRFDSTQGLFFKTNINSSEIEIKKIEKNDIGTNIKIKLKESVLNQFKQSNNQQLVPWDKWYTLANPKIIFNCLLDYNSKYGYNEFNPSYFETNSDWIEFTAKGYSKLRWSYKEKANISKNNYELTCNGLLIPEPPSIHFGAIPPPHVQIFDFNGILPINLNRNSLDSNILPFEKELIYSIFKYVLIQILKVRPNIIVKDNYMFISNNNERFQLHSKLNPYDFYCGLIYTSKGYFFKNRYLNDMVYGQKFISIEISDNEKIDKLSIKLDDSYVIQVERINKYRKGTMISDLYSKLQSIEWCIFEDQYFNKNSVEKSTKHIIDYVSFYNKKFVVVRKTNIIEIPLSLGMMTEFEILQLSSITCYSKFSNLPLSTNSAFNQFLSEIFSNLNECMIPYEDRARIEKIDAIISLLNHY